MFTTVTTHQFENGRPDWLPGQDHVEDGQIGSRDGVLSMSTLNGTTCMSLDQVMVACLFKAFITATRTGRNAVIVEMIDWRDRRKPIKRTSSMCLITHQLTTHTHLPLKGWNIFWLVYFASFLCLGELPRQQTWRMLQLRLVHSYNVASPMPTADEPRSFSEAGTRSKAGVACSKDGSWVTKSFFVLSEDMSTSVLSILGVREYFAWEEAESNLAFLDACSEEEDVREDDISSKAFLTFSTSPSAMAGMRKFCLGTGQHEKRGKLTRTSHMTNHMKGHDYHMTCITDGNMRSFNHPNEANSFQHWESIASISAYSQEMCILALQTTQSTCIYN